jgi:hypothetical protein
VHHHPDSARAAESIVEFLSDGDLIAVKGSRGMRLEKVVRALVEELSPDRPEPDTEPAQPVNGEAG